MSEPLAGDVCLMTCRTMTWTLAGPLALLLAACQPTVKVEAPKEPITINLNVKIDAEVRVKLEKQAEEDIASKPDIF